MHERDRVRDSFTLRKDLSARVEKLARQTGTSRSAIYRAAVQAYLEQHEQAAITSAINAVLANEEQELDFVTGAQRARVDAGVVDEWNE